MPNTARATLLAFALAATCLRAQENATATDAPSSALLSRLASRDLPVDEGRKIADQLRARTLAVRIDLFEAVRRAYLERVAAHDKAGERLHRDFRKAVASAQHAGVQHLGEAKIDALRKQALAVTARAELTESMIRGEIDPVMVDLRTALLPTADQVLAHDAEVAAAVAAAAKEAATTEAWFDLCLEAAHHLDGDPAGRVHATKAPPLPPPPVATPPAVEFETDCLLGLALGSQDQRALEANEALRGKTDAAEFAGTLELNRIRIVLGLNAVKIDEKLGNAARDHSNDMRTLGFFSHTSPVDGKHTFGDRASRAGTSAQAENIAQGHQRGEDAILGWWYSPGHHKNMLGSHARTGLGRSETTWTQMFGG